ncbi:TPA: hypothetical protein ACQ7UN_007072, partial [Burkholderia sola]
MDQPVRDTPIGQNLVNRSGHGIPPVSMPQSMPNLPGGVLNHAPAHTRGILFLDQESIAILRILDP